MSTFTNSEDPDEMPHNAAFHQGFHCLLKLKRSSDKKYIFFFNYNLTPLDMYNGLSQIDCIKPKGKSIGIQRVKFTCKISFINMIRVETGADLDQLAS